MINSNWVRAVAADKTRSQPWLTEDAHQEGMIAAWEAWQHQPGNIGYAMGAAKLRILNIARGDKFTGAPSMQGKHRPALAGCAPEDLPEASYDQVQFTPDRTEAEIAATREIIAVVSKLTPRQKHVVERVAFGMRLDSSQRGEWAGRLRPRLARELEHLRGVA